LLTVAELCLWSWGAPDSPNFYGIEFNAIKNEQGLNSVARAQQKRIDVTYAIKKLKG